MRRLKTVRRPPIYPKTPGHLPCSSLTHPLPLSSRRPSVSFGGFGLSWRLLTDSLYQDLPAKSNRLESQDAGVIGSQCFPVFAMLLSMISNFGIQAVRASFLGFPAARSRW